MTEKTCQTLPLDFENIRAKCPCCGSLMKLVMTWKSDGLQFDLIPAVEQKESGISPHGNSSLMNIVSVASAEQRLKDHMSSSKFLPPPHHRNGITLDEESNSSSLSANSVSRNFISASCQSQISLQALKSDQTSASHNYEGAASTSQNVFRNQAAQCSGQDTMFKCEMSECGQSFANSQQLELHYKQHKGEKVQTCDWTGCDRLFSSKEKLRNHIRCRHTGERPHKCGDCDKAFTSPKHLKDHRLLHTDERPFGCDWAGCDLRFRRRHHLVAHKRVHTKERPYNCQYPGCEMRFTKSHHVKRHYETHFKYRGADNGSAAATVAAAVSSAAACSSLSSALIGSYAFPTI